MYMFNSINFPERNDLRTFLTSSQEACKQRKNILRSAQVIYNGEHPNMKDVVKDEIHCHFFLLLVTNRESFIKEGVVKEILPTLTSQRASKFLMAQFHQKFSRYSLVDCLWYPTWLLKGPLTMIWLDCHAPLQCLYYLKVVPMTRNYVPWTLRTVIAFLNDSGL